MPGAFQRPGARPADLPDYSFPAVNLLYYGDNLDVLRQAELREALPELPCD